MFKKSMKRYLLIIPIIFIAFYAGSYYENKRLVGEPDTTIAVMVSALAIDNSQYQLQLNSEYLALLDNGQFNELKEKITSNNKVLTSIKTDAESVCKEVKCSNKHTAVIENAINN